MKKIALIGCGYWGKNYIKTLLQIKGFKLIWIYNKNTTISKKEMPKDCKFTTDYLKIIKDSEVDAVIIATPPNTHFKLAKQAILNEKDVLVEKPITDNSKSALKLYKLAQKNKRILMVGHIFIYHPAIIKLKEIIKRGSIGKILYIYSNKSSFGPIRKDLNVAWNLAPHDISIINYLINEYPQKITATGSSLLKKTIEDTVDVVMFFKKNVKAYLHLSWIEPQKTRKFIVVGDKKTAIFDDLSKNKLEIFENSDKNISQKIKTGSKSPLEKQCEHFLKCIKERKKPLTDGLEGIKNTIALEKIQKTLSN